MRGKTVQIRLTIDELPVLFTRKSIKHTYLRVDARTGDVCVNAPHRTPLHEVETLVRSHRNWIEKRRAQVASNPTGLQRMSDPERYALWGKSFRLEFIPSTGREKPIFDGETLFLPASPQPFRDEVQKRLNRWYREQLTKALPDYITQAEALTGLKADDYRIRDMKSCWGTCHSQDRRIYLNLKLVKYPPQCLEYVLIHELTHLIVPHHGPDFWAQVERHCPNWREIRKELNTL